VDVQDKEGKGQSFLALPIHPSPASALRSHSCVALSSGSTIRTLPQNNAGLEDKDTTGSMRQENNLSPCNNLFIGYNLCHSIIRTYKKQHTFQKQDRTGRTGGGVNRRRRAAGSLHGDTMTLEGNGYGHDMENTRSTLCGRARTSVPPESAFVDSGCSRRNTVMSALLLLREVIHVYQSDSSSKRPTIRSFQVANCRYAGRDRRTIILD